MVATQHVLDCRQYGLEKVQAGSLRRGKLSVVQLCGSLALLTVAVAVAGCHAGAILLALGTCSSGLGGVAGVQQRPAAQVRQEHLVEQLGVVVVVGRRDALVQHEDKVLVEQAAAGHGLQLPVCLEAGLRVRPERRRVVLQPRPSVAHGNGERVCARWRRVGAILPLAAFGIITRLALAGGGIFGGCAVAAHEQRQQMAGLFRAPSSRHHHCLPSL